MHLASHYIYVIDLIFCLYSHIWSAILVWFYWAYMCFSCRSETYTYLLYIYNNYVTQVEVATGLSSEKYKVSHPCPQAYPEKYFPLITSLTQCDCSVHHELWENRQTRTNLQTRLVYKKKEDKHNNVARWLSRAQWLYADAGLARSRSVGD